jgi:hypothetical protein
VLLRAVAFSAANTAPPATVFLRLVFAAAAAFCSSAILSNGLGALRSLRLILVLEVVSGVVPADTGGVRMDWRSRLTRVASAESSSGLQLMVCLSLGMRSLLSSCAAVAQPTSGGGGEGGRAGDLGDPPLLNTPEDERLIFGDSTIFALND